MVGQYRQHIHFPDGVVERQTTPTSPGAMNKNVDAPWLRVITDTEKLFPLSILPEQFA